MKRRIAIPNVSPQARPLGRRRLQELVRHDLLTFVLGDTEPCPRSQEQRHSPLQVVLGQVRGWLMKDLCGCACRNGRKLYHIRKL